MADQHKSEGVLMTTLMMKNKFCCLPSHPARGGGRGRMRFALFLLAAATQAHTHTAAVR